MIAWALDIRQDEGVVEEKDAFGLESTSWPTRLQRLLLLAGLCSK